MIRIARTRGFCAPKGTGEWHGSVGIADLREFSRLAKMAVDFNYPSVSSLLDTIRLLANTIDFALLDGGTAS
jgi:hypothetical protein